MNKLKKVLRYFTIYGFTRTIIKAAGRKRAGIIKLFFPKLFFPKKKSVSLIGTGQFGFSTISYYLLKDQGKVFLDCFDVDQKSTQSAADFYGYTPRSKWEDLLNNPQCEVVYIASNHASHAEYAIPLIEKGIKVYVEKPLVVNYDQLKRFFAAVKKSNNHQIYLGYNRPFSKAISQVKPHIQGNKLPLSLSFFIIGHMIPEGHWYRDPKEGTRICGNVGHWIDLMIHLMNCRGVIPDIFNIAISYANPEEPHDNIAITINTNHKDIVGIVFSSRDEPFEGVNETVNIQCGQTIAKIDDFRRMTLWNDSDVKRYKYWPKNVGHGAAIQQPFSASKQRDFYEVEISTIVMLEISSMVVKGETQRTIAPKEILASFKQ